MRKFFAAALILCVLALNGCSLQLAQRQAPVGRVITQMSIRFQNGPLQATRHFTSDEKMQPILNYLRQADAYGAPRTDPLCAPGSDFWITLSYSDGTEEHYRQRADRFLMGADGCWRRIDPKKAMQLSALLGKLHSD